MSAPATIAVIHNRYRQAGGEDAAVAAHIAVLESNGHRVVRFDSGNEELEALSAIGQAKATIWNQRASTDVRTFLAREKPHVAHFHNTFPLLSPAVYGAARRSGVAVVQSLHNYRIVCPNALLFRDGSVCEECVTKRVKWPAIVHACYRDSRAASCVTAGMLAVHAMRGTWRNDVDAYVALTASARTRFVAGGLPGDRIVVHPGFLSHDPGQGAHDGGFALFVGRLSAEKGVRTLLDAWRTVYRDGMTLRIVGSGPLDASLRQMIPGIEWMGECPNDRVLALMKEAALLVFPSECYEGFPMTLLEAFATGLPVLATSLGAMAEIVTHESTGRLFRPHDAADLGAALRWAFQCPAALKQLGAAARREFETKYTAAHAYGRLRRLYDVVGRGLAA